MAYGVLNPPGSKYGPCAVKCSHRDCEQTRTMATSKCAICQQSIGYDVRFYNNPDAFGLVHAECAEAKVAG